jgi:hypothetical protein
VEFGILHDRDEVQERYFDPSEADQFERHVRPILKYIPLRVLAFETGKSESFIRRIRNGHKKPSAKLEPQLTQLAAEMARYISKVKEDDDQRACMNFELKAN